MSSPPSPGNRRSSSRRARGVEPGPVPSPAPGEPFPAPGEAFEDTTVDPPVRGVLHRASGTARGGLVLTHGAGSHAGAPLLIALAGAFSARGLAVLRCDLPYRQQRRTGPPRPGEAAIDREGLRNALETLRRLAPTPHMAGGHSYGGRQASMVAAESPGLAAALLLLSYPLHPPDRPAQLRTAHLPRLETPTLFVHGSRDPFGSPEEMERTRALIPARAELLVADGAAHDLFHTRPASASASALVDRVVEAFLAFAGLSPVTIAEHEDPR